MEKRATVNFGDASDTARPLPGIFRRWFTWRNKATRTWLCPTCGFETPRALGFFDRG